MRNMADHYPHRGNQVEAWIKDRRDALGSSSAEPWQILDDLLDEYRLAADTGMSLEEIVNIDITEAQPGLGERKRKKEKK
jgi:hypothetical protein